MRDSNSILSALLGLVTLLALTGCPGGTGPSTTSEPYHPPVTTPIPQDDTSDLKEVQPAAAISAGDRTKLCNQTCSVGRLVERDDLMDISFDQLTRSGRVFNFRFGMGKCAITLKSASGGVAKMDSYNRWDSNQFAEPKNLHFTVGKANQTEDYCVPNGSVWERIDCQTQTPDHIMQLRRIDQPSGEQIWISTYKGWKGTLMAKKAGFFHPMVCQ